MKKEIIAFRDNDMFIFAKVDENKWIEDMYRYDEDPENPEWVHVHTTKFLTDESIDDFVIALKDAGFRVID